MRKIMVFSAAAFFLVFVMNFGIPVVQASTAKALEAPSDSAGQGHNASGIKHFNKEHWGIAEEHFQEAVKADEKLAEAHYNLALSLDKLSRHGEATQHFKKALDLAPDNPAIADSKILKDHLGM